MDPSPRRDPVTAPVIVVGAGPAGLAVGACLRRAGIEPVLLERERTVASSWRRHYDRLRARIPLIDVGTVRLIREGRVRVRPGIDRFTERGAVFEGGGEEPFDAVVLATGYRHDLAHLLPGLEGVLGADGRPLASGRECAVPGLYLCGFFVAPTGMLREIGLEARRIAEAIAQARSSRASVRRP
jgi:cation diffusion facilitator CzcD-associated flavoprotein CzcO